MQQTYRMQEVPIDPPAKSPRIIALDYLRGLFIAIIIIDHLWRWPNLFQFISGRGEMWASAAEGFVIISGLLVGYVHGYKKRHRPLRPIAYKLIRRGIMLYAWTVICTILFAASVWWFTTPDATTLSTPLQRGDWLQLLVSATTLSYISTWTHFLYFYALCLFVAPGVIWLLRQRQPIVVLALSVVGWYIGTTTGVEWLQWQLLFFTAAVIGYYFDILLRRYRRLTPFARKVTRWTPIVLFTATFACSLFITLSAAPGNPNSPLFGQSPLTLPTIALSLVWFAGLLSLFQTIAHKFPAWLRKLFLTLGERSLTAYILHIIPLIGCQLIFIVSDNIIANTLISAVAVYLTWKLMNIPHINRVIPQ